MRLITKRMEILLALIVVSGLIFPIASGADEFPARSITLYCGYVAGATTDLTTRGLAMGAEKILGVPIMVENKAGGGATVAATLLASKNDPRLVALVAYWWGRAPLKRQVDAGFSSFYFLVQHFDDMRKSLREEGINLDLDSPALPVARFFSDPPQGQDALGQVAAVPASCG